MTEQHPEHQHEEPQQQGLPEPPPILILTMTTDTFGRSNVRYQCTKEQAVRILREMSDSLESEAQAEAGEQQG